MKMMALGVRQPWAWLIIHGGKDIANRTQATRRRGRVLVHAAKKFSSHEQLWAFDWMFDAGFDVSPNCFETGGIIGSVEIVDCVTDHRSSWFRGPFGLVLRDPQSLPFYPCGGRHGFFDVELMK